MVPNCAANLQDGEHNKNTQPNTTRAAITVTPTEVRPALPANTLLVRPTRAHFNREQVLFSLIFGPLQTLLLADSA